ncbi:DUF3488 domain-containing transglutaminase family protein [bacterium]|nr:DUF3488 domain-containing transglutaminase family protein [bacterium]
METLTPHARRWLMTALSAVLLPHLLVLPWWLSSFVVLVLGLGWGRSFAGFPKFPGFLKYLLFFLALGGFFVTFGLPSGRSSGSALLVLMAALKPLEIERQKNARHLLLLSYFLVAAYFFSHQEIAAALWLFFAVFLITSALTALELNDEPFFSRRLLTPSLTLLSASLPLALILFLLFPRLPGPLWSFPEERRMAVTGLPNELEMGGISHLVRSSKVALRAEFVGPVPPPEKLYWRGPVFPLFDGRTWRRLDVSPVTSRSGLIHLSPLQPYTVTLEAHHQPWLLALDPPFSVPTGASFSASYEVLLDRPLHQLHRYQMATAEIVKWPAEWVDRGGWGATTMLLSQIAQQRNPRSFELARSWAEAELGDEALVERLLNLFRQNPFRYTLDPPSLGGSGPVDEFIFQTQAGFCEHYAGSAAFLLRAAGLQARVVAGYLGGERHPVGGYLIVRQYNAHAWIEVRIKDKGWVRIDPTAAVAPERVEIGIAAAFPESDAFFLWREGRGIGWLRKVGQYRDLAEFYWNYWVLGYGPKLQNLFLGRFGLGLHHLNLWITALIGLPFLALLLGLGILNFGVFEKIPPEVKLYRIYCRRRARHGCRRKLSETPTAYAQRLAQKFPAEMHENTEIAVLYLDLRYGKRSPGDVGVDLKRLRQLCRR